ncbi:MAG: hypothetical protein AMXMBFR36_02880 [Acidobacteriota bacterium]
MPSIRIIPNLEREARLVHWVQAPVGRFAIFLIFLASLAVTVRGSLLLDTAVVLALVTWLPTRRRTILVFAALYWAYLHVHLRWDLLGAVRERAEAGTVLPDFGLFRFQVIAAALLSCALLHVWFRSRPSMLAARYPAWFLAGLHILLAAALSASPWRGLTWLYAWGFLLVFGSYLWFLAYALLDLRKHPEREFSEHIGLFHPFWGSTSTPFPKGRAYADEIEAKDAEALAVSQLRGIKLLWWSILLAAAAASLRAIFFGQPIIGQARLPFGIPVPPLEIAFQASVQGHPFPWIQNASAMFLDLAIDGLSLSVWGHQFIAIARMAGFDARRNTYKPFLATSVSDFFNRYYYYFKELLVDFFFHPTIYSLPRRRFKLSLFVATLAAAGVGNFLYHLIRDLHVVAERGLVKTLVDSRVHALYCLVLALAIFVSQVRRIGRRPEAPTGLVRWRKIVAVWLFFALLSTLYVDMRNTALIDHVRFFADSLPLSLR